MSDVSKMSDIAHMTHVTVALFLAVVCASSAFAQDSREVTLELTHVKEAIVVDGVMNDDGWRDVPVLPAAMYTPVFNGPVTERSELRVVYADANLYIGG